MARMGDEDEVGRGASVAQLSDAARRRSERAPNPGHDDVPPAPDPSAGIDLITNVRADEHDTLVEALADDVLDEALAGQWGAPEAALRASPAREGPEDESAPDPIDPDQDDHQHVREVLEHHHERRNPRELPTRTPRGSADLAPPVRRSSAPGERRPPVRAPGRTRARRRVAGGLAAVIAIVIIAAEAGSSAAKHHGTPAAVTQATIQGVSSPTSVIASDMTRATAAIGVEGKTAASAHAAMKTKEKARAEARARARSKAAERARAARVRRHQAAAARAPASSTAGSTAAGSTGATTTEPVYNPPSSPTSSSSTGSTSASGGGSGSSSAPAGPTGIGSAGGSCNPKCS